MSKFCYAAALSLIVLMLQASPAAADPMSEYFDYIISQTIDDPQWKSEIAQCEKVYYQSHMRVFKKGWQQEIDNATSKSQAEEMKEAMPLLDDQVMFRAVCVKTLALIMFEPKGVSRYMMPDPNRVRMKGGEQAVEWRYPTAQMKAFREDLTDKALMTIKQQFHNDFVRSTSITDARYPEIRESMVIFFSTFKQDFDYFSTSDREARSVAGPYLFNRGIYVKLASSKQYSDDVSAPELHETTTPEPKVAATEQKLTAPSHCKVDEATLFTGVFGKKVLSFCATPAKMPYVQIEYRYGLIGKLDMTYSATTKGDSPKLFFDSVANDPRSSTEVMWFQKGTFIYAVLQCNGGTCESGGPSLVVFNGKKKLLESKCQGESECDFHFPVSDDGSGPKSLSPIILLKDAPSQLGL